MPKANEQKAKAKMLFEQGLSMVEIAEELNIKSSTIRSWKKRDSINGIEWIATQREKVQRNEKKTATQRETLQRKKPTPKRGKRPNKVVSEKEKANLAPPFEKGNQAALKHGAYAKYLSPAAAAIYEEVCDEERIDLLDEAISVKFANIISAQNKLKPTNPGHAKADSEAMRTLASMIKAFIELKGTTKTDTSEEDGFIEALLNDTAASDWSEEE